MPVLSEETRNQILDGWLGANRGSGSPSSYSLELWQDDPRSVGAAQADFGGYTPATVSSSAWDPADGGAKQATSLISFGTPSGAGTDAIRYWALRNVTSGVLAYSAKLERPVYVSASTSALYIRPTVLG